MLVSLQTNGRPQSTNIRVIKKGPRKISNEDIGQDGGKLETWLDKMQPAASTPRRKKPAPKKNITKGGTSKRTA